MSARAVGLLDADGSGAANTHRSTSGRLVRQLTGSLREVSREQLLEEGVPPAQVNVRMAQQSMVTQLMMIFAVTVACMICLMCVAFVLDFGFFIWMCIAQLRNHGNECDNAMNLWVNVTVGIMVVMYLLDKANGWKYVCCWDRDQNLVPPRRVQALYVVKCFFEAAWSIVGIVWASQQSTSKPCDANLKHAVLAYAIVHFPVSALNLLASFGTESLVLLLTRWGLLPRTQQAAPPGSLEANSTEVQTSDPALEDQATCPICLEAFADGEQPVVKTNHCGHCFHTHCLQGWLNTASSCPNCRHDLAIGTHMA
eukprot:TRINITY_DN93864_c0_g1_i1.p1 TRINITY_DN93864_c0_g1~~TRINITY_DN93864_c0_g1_i1.p1  ORF type:complete len:311 (+),score=27.33 TRINITY_DN93864_c0_g1_i1:47-979(+)